MWMCLPGLHAAAPQAVEDVLLMMDPTLCCDTFCHPKQPGATGVCCDDLPGPFTTDIGFVLSGRVVQFRLDPPPCPAFSYPFIGGAPLAVARKQTAYVEAACDIIGAFVQEASRSRVRLAANRAAIASLEPAATWLMSVGFQVDEEGFCSPDD